jgi:threonine dehydrogenase-like Zn-dependent dehydrogenase
VLAAVTRSPGELVVEDVSGPRRARPGHVIVRPEAVGICGSDFHLFSGEVAALSGASDFYPRIQGHEVAAIVEDPGDTSHNQGDRVAIWPLLPCGRCYPCRIGRPNVITEARDWTDGEGPPLVIETSGATSVLSLATRMVAPAGRVVVVGMSSGTAPVRPGIFPEKEIDVLGSSTATAADFRAAISLVAANRQKIAKIFSHHFPLARAAEAFEFAMSRPPDAVKVVVTMNGRDN